MTGGAGLGAAAAELRSRMTAGWDAGAARYDERAGHGVRTPLEERAWDLLLRRLLPPDPPLRVLDVGCGTGAMALRIAPLGHDVVGLDLSSGMLGVAAARAREHGLSVTWLEGDAEAVPLPPGDVDVVVSRHVLRTLLEPERAVRDWVRVTRPGGEILGIGPARRADDPRQWLAERAGWALDAIRRGGRPRAAGGHSYGTEVERLLPLHGVRDSRSAEGAFRRGGLVDVRSEELGWLDTAIRAGDDPVSRLRSATRHRYLVEGRVGRD